MKIYVCIKQVPDTETRIRILPSAQQIDPSGVKWIINPYDEFAIEEALKIRDANAGSTVTLMSAGPKHRTVEALRTGLAMGADEAVLIDTPETFDIFSTAKALSLALQQSGGFDLIFTGKLAIDDNASAVSQMLAEYLKIPHATVISKMTLTGNAAVLERDGEGGCREIIEVNLPVVVAANKGLNTPRYASLPGIMRAKKKTIKELSLEQLGLKPEDQRVVFVDYRLPPERPPARLIAGAPEEQAQILVRLLRQEAKII